MNTIIGPILKRAGGYVFDTWDIRRGLNESYPYRRIEDANYARNAAIRDGRAGVTFGAVVCHTLDEFLAQTTEGALLTAA
jgi:hypothetical protein